MQDHLYWNEGIAIYCVSKYNIKQMWLISYQISYDFWRIAKNRAIHHSRLCLFFILYSTVEFIVKKPYSIIIIAACSCTCSFTCMTMTPFVRIWKFLCTNNGLWCVNRVIWYGFGAGDFYRRIIEKVHESLSKNPTLR